MHPPLAERIVKEADRLGADRRRPARPEPHRDPGGAAREPVPLEVLRRRGGRPARAGGAAAGIPLQVHPGVTGALVACDRGRSSSALANLLDNAVKYSEPGSRSS